MATSVLTCMNHGLIPIVTKETGILINGWGSYLEEFSVEYVCNIVKRCSLIDDDILHDWHKKVYEHTRANYNLEAFTNDFKQVIGKIIKN